MRHSYLGGTGTPPGRRDTQDVVMTTHSRPIPRDKNGAGIPSCPPASLLIGIRTDLLTSHWSIGQMVMEEKGVGVEDLPPLKSHDVISSDAKKKRIHGLDFSS
ncbi:hypothetical protein CDAR_27551 [Caerostris darwini]|uniref:Uncharacterized protein n=1 Tax=Caerostris darwini TaxID=1538125 RepID=A0AAV4ST33_9ARAC|nr:hypothetical protein CDAR_27551 [Caerostris darwini]